MRTNYLNFIYSLFIHVSYTDWFKYDVSCKIKNVNFFYLIFIKKNDYNKTSFNTVCQKFANENKIDLCY